MLQSQKMYIKQVLVEVHTTDSEIRLYWLPKRQQTVLTDSGVVLQGPEGAPNF